MGSRVAPAWLCPGGCQGSGGTGGCTGRVQGRAEMGLTRGLHDLEAEETPQSLSVIPRAASVGINPKQLHQMSLGSACPR